MAGVSSQPTPGGQGQGLAGTYVGSFGAGRAVLFAYPDGSVSGWVGSTAQPDRRDAFLGAVSPAGDFALLGALGTRLTGDLSGLQASWEQTPIALSRVGVDDQAGVYAGTTLNETYAVGGVWSAIVDPNGDLTAVFSYPTQGFVSDVVVGRADASGAVQFASAADVGSGRFEHGYGAGRWSARDGSQRGSWQGYQAPPGQRTTVSAGIPGAYVGTYRSNAGVADAGQIGVVIYPDFTFFAFAVSTQDPRRRDVAFGVVAPDGSLVGGPLWSGATLASGNLTQGGTYTGSDSSGSFSVRRAASGEVYAGTLFNTPLGLPGIWVGLVDGQGRATLLAAYPTLLMLGESGRGTVAPDGAIQTLSPNGDTSTGRLQNAMGGGTWSSPSTGQFGWWTGFRLP
ncbi:MAG: hypothetical protein KDD82_08445 [Planctomycetes bacterium]|nr:hypothetical protein [Planctomycetota bacterium]